MSIRLPILACVVANLVALVSGPAAATAAPGTRVLAMAQVARQSVPTPPGAGNQSNVVVQAQVAASPADPNVAAAVTETGLQATSAGTFGVALAVAVTRNGGASWSSHVVPGITVAAGGPWLGVSWPTVAVAPDGTIYIVAAVRSADPCHMGLGVLRSTDAGRTFGQLVLVQVHHQCGRLEGRSSLAVDAGPLSPHKGRLYLAWTSYRTDADGTPTGQVQTISRSEDQGLTWSAPTDITTATSSTFGNTLLVGPDGQVTDVYGSNSPDFRRLYIDASNSYDGGLSFDPPTIITRNYYATVGASDIRCCVPSAAVDSVNGELYVAFGDARFQDGKFDDALVYRSGDGVHWTGPVRADVAGRAGLEHLTPEIAAYDGHVYVSWALTPDPNGTWIREQVASSIDGGQSFGVAVGLGPVGDLRYAALASGFGYWLGDVAGIAAGADRAYLAWPLPTTPLGHGAQNQTLWAATVTLR